MERAEHEGDEVGKRKRTKRVGRNGWSMGRVE